jgi:aarF domain-containing kinase
MDDGRIAFLDYGQVKKLTDVERITIARLVSAIANGNKEEVLQINKETGYRSKYNNPDIMWKVITVIFDRDGRDVTDGLNLQQYIDKLYSIDPWEDTADFFVMPIRLSLLMRGVGLMLNHPVSVCSEWKLIAEKVVKEYEFKTGIKSAYSQ